MTEMAQPLARARVCSPGMLVLRVEAKAKFCALTHNKSYPQEIVASDKIVPLSILVKGRNDEAEHDDSSEARAIGGVADAVPQCRTGGAEAHSDWIC